MNAIHYIGLDVRKKTISYCIKTAAGQIVKEGTVAAERSALRSWAASLQQPWHGSMEATIFSAWIYDTLMPYAERLEMGHPAKMKAITAGKKKKRCHRCSHHSRSGALRLTARLLCVSAGSAGPAPTDALSPDDGSAVGQDAQQDGRPADGERGFVSQDQAARQEVLQQFDQELRGSAGGGEGSAAHESRGKGNVRRCATAVASKTAGRRWLTAARGAFEQHRRGGRDYRSHLGAGGRRPASFCLHCRC